MFQAETSINFGGVYDQFDSVDSVGPLEFGNDDASHSHTRLRRNRQLRNAAVDKRLETAEEMNEHWATSSRVRNDIPTVRYDQYYNTESDIVDYPNQFYDDLSPVMPNGDRLMGKVVPLPTSRMQFAKQSTSTIIKEEAEECDDADSAFDDRLVNIGAI